MSRFLGPIHHWLFNKIVLFEQLERDVVNNVEDKLKADLSDIVQNSVKEFGASIPDMPLEELIDTGNIHGWLQEKINIAEGRQAKIITDLINKFGNVALDIIKDTYKEQGRLSGINAKSDSSVDTPADMFKTINNYILDGMPCDNANNVTINDENTLQWKVINCLHKKYWDKVNGDINVLYELREIWVTEFVKNANPELLYTFNTSEIVDNKVLIHEIKK